MLNDVPTGSRTVLRLSMCICVSDFSTPQIAQSSLSSAVSWTLLRFVCVESVMLSNHLILCHPLLLLPSIFSSISIFLLISQHQGLFILSRRPINVSTIVNCGIGFDPWGGKIPWRRKWQPTPVLLPGKFHGLRSLVGYSP